MRLFAICLEASTGMRYVLVNGMVLIDEARLVPNAFPGRALGGH